MGPVAYRSMGPAHRATSPPLTETIGSIRMTYRVHAIPRRCKDTNDRRRNLVAMGLPILTASFGIAIGFALEDLLGLILNVPIFAPEMLAMIGLGVGIDCARFIVTRYRQGVFERHAVWRGGSPISPSRW
jgi:hypothetical protein